MGSSVCTGCVRANNGHQAWSRGAWAAFRDILAWTQTRKWVAVTRLTAEERDSKKSLDGRDAQPG